MANTRDPVRVAATLVRSAVRGLDNDTSAPQGYHVEKLVDAARKLADVLDQSESTGPSGSVLPG